MYQVEDGDITFEEYLKKKVNGFIEAYKSNAFKVNLTISNYEKIDTFLVTLGDDNMYFEMFPINSEGKYEVKVNLYGANMSGGKSIEVSSN